MRILLLGNSGQLGYELERCLQPLGPVLTGDYPAFNLAEPDAALAWLRTNRPDVVINATAYTLVDQAESAPDLAFAINGRAPGLLAEEARRLGAAFIHYSTDYVFDGSKGSPYVESDATNPLSAYGRSKLAGEQAVAQVGGAYLVLRTAWVYSTRRDSFVSKTLAWARKQPELRLVSDQVSNPTWCRQLAEITTLLLAGLNSGGAPAAALAERAGLYHLAGDGWCSRLDWGKEILRLDPNPQEQQARQILPALTSEFPAPAARPLFSALDCSRFSQTFGLRLPPWQEALRLAMRP